METAAYGKRWAALFVLAAAQFMVIMDTSIIGVALPAIKEALGYSQAGLQWIFNAYVIFFGGLLLLGGRLSDLFGPRKVFAWGFAILSGASLLAGLAWSEAAMNTGRALQGLGSALIAPSALTLLMSMFKDTKELGKALGVWGASAAAGGSAGVFLGGVITQYLSWEWVFLVNIPAGVLVLALTPGLLPQGAKQRGKVDIFGALTATASLVVTVYALVTDFRWLALGAALFGAFLVAQRVKREPLVPLSIFRRPNLSAANAVMALMAAAWIPLWFFLNLYLQQVLELSAFASGLALLPMTIAIMVLMVGFTGKLVERYGFKGNLVAGLGMMTASLALFAQAPVEGSFLVHVLPASLLAALGMSLAYIPGTMAAMSGAKPEETGLASGIVNTSYQIGSALGLAGIVAVASTVTGEMAARDVAQVIALNEGFRTAFIGAGVIGAVATLLAATSIRGPRQTAISDVTDLVGENPRATGF